MGRKFEPVPEVRVWALERCEETVLIGAWLRVQGRIPATEHWKDDFEYRLFERGDCVSERHLTSMNRHLRRIGDDEIRFEETNPSDYCRAIDKETRRKDRRHIKECLESMNVSDRANSIAAARAAMDALEPCHRTYAEWKEARGRPTPSTSRILNAVCEKPVSTIIVRTAETPEAPQATSAKMPVDLAMRLLEHTTDAETRNHLVRVIVDAYAP